MKTLNTTKLTAIVMWTRIRHMAPRDFNSIADMQLSRDILNIIGETMPELSSKIVALEGMKDATPQERNSAGEEYNALEAKVGDDKVAAEFEDAEFNYLFQLFTAHGKDWFNTVDEFLTLNAQMNETNSAPKAKKEK